MSLEKFVKKLKKFLENRGARLQSVKIRMFDDLTTNNIYVFYSYNGIRLRSSLQFTNSYQSIKSFSVHTFGEIEDNLKRVSNVQNMHKG